MTFVIRAAASGDAAPLSILRATLWPESSAEEHARELELMLTGRWPAMLPQAVLVCVDAERGLCGFVEVALRSYADGCDATQPVGYLEGWFVREECRRRGIGTALLRAAEQWARLQGATEMASDAAIDNAISQRAHEALGFEVVGRAVQFRKQL
jgi:aminoglycoside 6'-N-acetyltransferase I